MSAKSMRRAYRPAGPPAIGHRPEASAAPWFGERAALPPVVAIAITFRRVKVPARVRCGGVARWPLASLHGSGRFSWPSSVGTTLPSPDCAPVPLRFPREGLVPTVGCIRFWPVAGGRCRWRTVAEPSLGHLPLRRRRNRERGDGRRRSYVCEIRGAEGTGLAVSRFPDHPRRPALI